MPPHCDSMDGPVVIPYVPKEGEEEVTQAFAKVISARKQSPEAKEVADRAIETGSPDELLKLMTDVVQGEIREKFEHLMHLKEKAQASVDEAREYVSAMLGLEVYSHKLYQCTKTGPHEAHHEHD